jgi:hypothetical protein
MVATYKLYKYQIMPDLDMVLQTTECAHRHITNAHKKYIVINMHITSIIYVSLTKE